MPITIETKVPHLGGESYLRLSNGKAELLLATEYGPRVMHYALRGGANVLGALSPREQWVDTPFGERWHIHGGHRLWYAPEDAVRSYFPDNRPVSVQVEGAKVSLTQALEPHTQLEKSMHVELDERSSRVRLRHRLVNRASTSIELAPWALTVMAKGGRAIFPHAPFAPHPHALAPSGPLVLWPFTRMNDPRWTWGDRFFFLRQDPQCEGAQKVGFYNTQGFMLYHSGRQLFVKTHSALPGKHADFGCNAQTFTNEAMLELETLGPLVTLEPGASVEHDEAWFLFDDVDLPSDESALAERLAPLLAEVRTPGGGALTPC